MWDKPNDFDGEEPVADITPQNDTESKASSANANKSSEIDDTSNMKTPEWVEVYDPSSSAYYFYNNTTGECTWERPKSYQKPKGADARSLMAPPLFAALMVQKAWRKKLARRDVRAQRGKVAAKQSDSIWQAIRDPASGFDYYYNSETGDMQWEKPDELLAKEEKVKESKDSDIVSKDADEAEVFPEWLEIWDSTASTFYYYNQVTGENTWDKPKDFKRPNYSNMKAMMKPEVRAAVLVQNAWRKKLARRDVRAQRGKNASADSTERWQKVHDPSSGQDYYYDSQTGDVQWEKPDELKTKEEKCAPSKEEIDTKKESYAEWLELWDTSASAYYYYNQISGESQWDRPEDFESSKPQIKI